MEPWVLAQHWESRGKRTSTEIQGHPQLRRGHVSQKKKMNTLLLLLPHKEAYLKLTALLGARELDTLAVRNISCSQKGPRLAPRTQRGGSKPSVSISQPRFPKARP